MQNSPNLVTDQHEATSLYFEQEFDIGVTRFFDNYISNITFLKQTCDYTKNRGNTYPS
jgi:hypothetical protein